MPFTWETNKDQYAFMEIKYKLRDFWGTKSRLEKGEQKSDPCLLYGKFPSCCYSFILRASLEVKLSWQLTICKPIWVITAIFKMYTYKTQTNIFLLCYSAWINSATKSVWIHNENMMNTDLSRKDINEKENLFDKLKTILPCLMHIFCILSAV